MKNQKLTYLLLPLAIIIWGFIIWKIFFSNSTQVQYAVSKPVQNLQDTVLQSEHAVKALQLNYGDPFLKRNVSVVKSNETEKKKTEKKVFNRVVRWPQIEYKGMVSGNGKNSGVGMILIGNKNFLVRRNQDKNGIHVLEIYKDSILLELDQDQKTFLLKQDFSSNLHSKR